MKNIKTFDEFVNESNLNEASIATKDWDRMLSLVMKNDDGETAAKLIKKKDKAIARFVSGLKLSNSPLSYDDKWERYTRAFSPLGDRALELGATPEEIQELFDKTVVPVSHTEKMTKLGGKKLDNRFVQDISKVFLTAGNDIEYLPHNGNAITSNGRDAMQRNGRKWTIGYKSEVTIAGNKFTFNFDAITDEGGGATYYVIGDMTDKIFQELEWKTWGKLKFISGLKEIIKEQTI